MEQTLYSKKYSGASFSKMSFKAGGLLEIEIYLLFFTGIITSLTSVLPFSSYLNRLIMGLYLILSLFLILKKAKAGSFLFLICLFGLLFVDIIISGASIRKINDLFYFPLWSLNLLVFVFYYDELKNVIKRKHRLFFIFAVLWNIINLSSVIYPGSFILSNNIKAFVGFAGQAHRFSETALMALLFGAIEYSVTRKKRVFLLMIFPILSTYLSGARTYLIVALLFALFMMWCFSRKKIIKFIILFGGIVFVAYAGFYMTSMRMGTQDYAWQIANYGTLHFITSGRSDFWQIDLEHFFTSPYINIMIGNGYNYVYEINELFYNSPIYAHNDYINILLAHGFIGLLMFLGTFISFISAISKRVHIKKIYLLFYLAIVIFNASFNMVYTYAVASLITPIFGMAMIDIFDEKQH